MSLNSEVALASGQKMMICVDPAMICEKTWYVCWHFLTVMWGVAGVWLARSVTAPPSPFWLYSWWAKGAFVHTPWHWHWAKSLTIPHVWGNPLPLWPLASLESCCYNWVQVLVPYTEGRSSQSKKMYFIKHEMHKQIVSTL